MKDTLKWLHFDKKKNLCNLERFHVKSTKINISAVYA